MAYLLNLYCEDSTHSYNLLTDTLALVEGTRYVTRDSGSYSETMELISVVGSTDKNIILAENEINEMGDLARAWANDRTRCYAVWLEENAASETKRRSLIKNIVLQQVEGLNTSKLLGRQGVSIWSLYIEYQPFFEPVTPESLTTSGLSAWGGIWKPTMNAYQKGVMDGRIQKLSITPTTATQLSEFWFGIRAPRETGVLDEFKCVWELETEGSILMDTALASVSGASPSGSSVNNCLYTTFATHADYYERCGIMVQSGWVGAGRKFSQVVGKYLVFLRCKVSAATTVRVEMRTGYPGAYRPGPTVDISNTDWAMIPVGEITIPAVSYRAELASLWSYDLVAQHAFRFWAERLTGSGGIWWDAICLIPSDCLVYVKCESALWANIHMDFYTFADDGKQCLLGGTAGFSATIDYSMQNWGMPMQDPVCVLLAQYHSTVSPIVFAHSLTQTATVLINHLPRWRGFSLYA